MTTKWCGHCSTEKDIEEFRYVNKAKGSRQRHCAECCRLQGKAHYANNRERVIQTNRNRSLLYRDAFVQFRQTLVCPSCGESAESCLDFHHVDPSTKEHSITNLKFYSWDTIRVELDKCVCLCSNCHRKVHAEVLRLDDRWIANFRQLLHNYASSVGQSLAFEAG